MRLIADGVVDREGVDGLARMLGYGARHVHRELVAEVGAGPQALARAQRAQTARVLIETTKLPFAEVAFAAGFASIRQFNDTIKQVFDSTPTGLRRRSAGGVESSAARVLLRLPYRSPFDPGVLDFLGARAVPGVEEASAAGYTRSLRLPAGSGLASLAVREGYVECALELDDLRDLAAAVQRCRALLDLDCDPTCIDGHLGGDPALRPAVARQPGRRLPGTTDPFELAVRAILGQQVSVAGAQTLAGRLVAARGKPLTAGRAGVTHLFPDPEALAGADLLELGMPGSRRRALRCFAEAVADGRLVLDRGAERDEVMEKMKALPGIGPWTASYVAMRALGDPDAFLSGDLGVRKAAERLGLPGSPSALTVAAERWRPWRSYAVQYLWRCL